MFRKTVQRELPKTRVQFHGSVPWNLVNLKLSGQNGPITYSCYLFGVLYPPLYFYTYMSKKCTYATTYDMKLLLFVVKGKLDLNVSFFGGVFFYAAVFALLHLVGAVSVHPRRALPLFLDKAFMRMSWYIPYHRLRKKSHRCDSISALKNIYITPVVYILVDIYCVILTRGVISSVTHFY